MNKYKPFFESFFSALEDSKIAYTVLRGFEELPDSYSNDVDFGVLKEDLYPFLRILKEQGEIFKGTLVLFKVRLDVYKFKLKLPFQDIDIDIWTSFNFGGLPYLNHWQMVSAPIYHNGFKVLNPENEVALSFLKEFLHLNWLRKDKVAILKSKMNNNFQLPFEEYFNKELIHSFKKSIQDEVFDLKPISFKAKATLVKNNIRRNGLLTTVKSVLSFINVRLNSKKIINTVTRNI